LNTRKTTVCIIEFGDNNTRIVHNTSIVQYTFENIEKYVEFIQNYAEPLHVRFCLLGHFGRDKTESKIRERYYWAIVTLKTIQECCRVCNKSYFTFY
jgi:hypothetical protein